MGNEINILTDHSPEELFTANVKTETNIASKHNAIGHLGDFVAKELNSEPLRTTSASQLLEVRMGCGLPYLQISSPVH